MSLTRGCERLLDIFAGVTNQQDLGLFRHGFQAPAKSKVVPPYTRLYGGPRNQTTGLRRSGCSPKLASVPDLRRIDYQLPNPPDFARSVASQSSTVATNDKERPPRTTRSISPSRKCGPNQGEFRRKPPAKSPPVSRSRGSRDDGRVKGPSRRSTIGSRSWRLGVETCGGHSSSGLASI